MRYLKLYTATLLTISLLYGIWLESYKESCFALLIVAIILPLIAYGFIDLKVEQRRCFRDCFFRANSIFFAILSSKSLIMLFYLIASLLMSLSLLYLIIDLNSIVLLYLLAHIALCITLYSYLKHRLSNIITQGFYKIFAREWSIDIMAIVIIIVYFSITLNSFEPAFLQTTLSETFLKASNSIYSNCHFTNYFLKIQKEIDSIFWYIIENSTQQIRNELLHIAIWTLFLISNSLAILGINRLIVTVIYILDQIFYSGEKSVKV